MLFNISVNFAYGFIIKMSLLRAKLQLMTPQCGRAVVQVLVVRVDIEVVIYKAMIPQCGRSVVQVLIVRVDNIGSGGL